MQIVEGMVGTKASMYGLRQWLLTVRQLCVLVLVLVPVVCVYLDRFVVLVLSRWVSHVRGVVRS